MCAALTAHDPHRIHDLRRGRLDIAAITRHPVVRTAGIVLGPPLAKPGDYYLFDSTGFVLVRPATRTFSSFPIANDSRG